MANIKLNSLEKYFNDNTPKSPEDLSKIDTEVKYLYKDLKLDITDINETGVFKSKAINSNISVKDIEASFDEQAVLNSVKNWLLTDKMSRLLNPELALDLRHYIFEGANEYTAYFLGMDIMRTLPFYEPRIVVDTCKISVNEDEGYFIIDLSMKIPSLNNKQINLKELLDSTGYTTI